MTQRELGFEAGLDQMTISRIERGERLPSLPSLILIANATGHRASYLIQRIESTNLPNLLMENPQTAYRKRGRQSQKHPEPPKQD